MSYTIRIALVCLAAAAVAAPTLALQDEHAPAASEGAADALHGEHGKHAEHGEHSGHSENAERGEHGEGGEHGSGEGSEESGTEFALDETYDEVRHGARLILSYDAEGKAFVGTVENTTDEPLARVRVEVHQSNGKELGPTTPVDLGPGEKRPVKLSARGQGFDGWSAHPEVGDSEHGHGEKH
jgi:hypothetical protein